MPVDHDDRRIVLVAKDASAEILLYGATVVSWRARSPASPSPVERLFVSSRAALDGTRPVRGGIPIVFPCFGRPSHPEHARLSQHGFARTETWALESVLEDDASGVSVRLALAPSAGVKATYDRSFRLAYVVTLAEHQLSTDLHVTNTSAPGMCEDRLQFQALFHNYICAPANEALVFPLQNKTYYDKTEATEQGRNTPKTETRVGVDVREHTDSVYEDASQRYEVRWPSGGIEIAVEGLKDVVVWNPQRVAGSKIADMEDGGWERYVCVEPGHVRGFADVEAGQTWTGRQVLRIL